MSGKTLLCAAVLAVLCFSMTPETGAGETAVAAGANLLFQTLPWEHADFYCCQGQPVHATRKRAFCKSERPLLFDNPAAKFPVAILFDESGGTETGYDTLYVDFDADGQFADDPVYKADKGAVAGAAGFGGDVKACFANVRVVHSRKRNWLPRVQVALLSGRSDDGQVAESCVMIPQEWAVGTVNVDGRKLAAALIDRNWNDRLTDAGGLNLQDPPGGFPRGDYLVLGIDGEKSLLPNDAMARGGSARGVLTEHLVLDSGAYRVKAGQSARGVRLDLLPVKATTGRLKLPATMTGRRLCLIGTKTCVLLAKPTDVVTLPADTYVAHQHPEQTTFAVEADRTVEPWPTAPPIKSNLAVREIKLEPIGEGKNAVRVQVQNTADQRQTFAIHIQTRSPQHGRRGIGWGSAYFDTFQGKETKWLRFAFKIFPPVTDDAWVRLRFYNPDSREIYDFKRYFLEKKQTAGQLERRRTMGTSEPASKEQAQEVTRAFLQIQGDLKQKKYSEIWDRFTKDCQEVEYLGLGLDHFRKTMDELSVFWWDRVQFLQLQPRSVARRGGLFVLTATRDEESWEIDFLREDGQWKIDWIRGYTTAVAAWGSWEERLLPKMEKHATDHFDIHYFKGSTAAKRIPEIAEAREKGYRGICDFLGTRSKLRIRLVLFEDENTKFRTTGHQGMGWAYGTTLVEVCGPEGRLDPYHETTHVLTRDLGRPPALFVEGIAVYMTERLGAPALEYLGGGKSSLHERVRQLRKSGEWIGLQELLTYTEIGSGKTRPTISYAQAGSFVKFLMDAYGKEKFFRAYGTLQNSPAAGVQQQNRKALEAIYGQSLAELETSWHKAFEAASRP
ncbi:MAG: hypothetical protein AMJ81_08540 [Phycisphaerae bacterium SM23_33]|nr:MAG: hypothetical protein AMJ81_08540 [Phycisphaerae bacterium SM23_33]